MGLLKIWEDWARKNGYTPLTQDGIIKTMVTEFCKHLESIPVELPVKPEICVNTDKLNGSGEYYHNAKLSELFTLNNLIPQLETKVDFVEGEELTQYEVSQIYYIAKERIAINIYLNEY